MRESIGGAFLIKLMVIFIVIYNSLLAIAINYAVAFRVKNQIINLLEQYEGCELGGGRVENYVNSIGYYRAATPTEKSFSIVAHPTPNRGTYYTVTTYIAFDLPFFRVFKERFRIRIVGETKLIYGVYEDNHYCNNLG